MVRIFYGMHRLPTVRTVHGTVYPQTQWLWSRIRDRTNDCLWSLQPIRKASTASVQLPGD